MATTVAVCCGKHRTAIINNLCRTTTTTSHGRDGGRGVMLTSRHRLLTTSTQWLAGTPHHEGTFDRELYRRRSEASNSVLIHHEGNTSESDLLSVCRQYGDVRNYFSYSNPGVYSVVEYETRGQLDRLLTAVKFPPENNGKPIPLQSRLLDFGGKTPRVGGKRVKQKHTQPQILQVIGHDQLMAEICRDASTVDQQMEILVQRHHLQDNNIRLRYLVCSLVEEAVARILPNSLQLKPFGSTVNLLGRRDADLDISLDFISRQQTQDEAVNLFFKVNKHSSERALIQGTLASLANYLQDFVPGCVGVQRILNARCPLVKFVHLPSGLCCDLTGSNKQALKSSEMLNLYARLDPRFTPLVTTLRYWAKVRSLTHSNPGPWLSSFSITALVIFFMQVKSILPPVDVLKSVAGDGDRVIIEGHDCTITSTLSSIPPTENREKLSELLLEFFEFYGKLDFRGKSLCLRTGQVLAKHQDGRPLVTHNPFETSHNISQNMNQSQLDRFIQEIQNALWVTAHPEYGGQRSGERWGLGTLFMDSAEMSKKNPKAPKLTSLLGDLVATLSPTNSQQKQHNVVTEQGKFKSSKKSGVDVTRPGDPVPKSGSCESMESVLQSYTVELPTYTTNSEGGGVLGETNVTPSKPGQPPYYLRYSVGMGNLDQARDMNLPLMFMNGIRMRRNPRKKTLKMSMIKDLQRKLQSIASSLMS